jgi:ATP-dependent helicase/nuclease subunit B
MKFFNIPSNYNFLESLYEFITNEFSSDINLSSVTLFLPSRRSVNELKRIFIEKKKTVFLPTIRAIGDIDYDDIIANSIDAEIIKKMVELTKPIAHIKYKLLLLEEFLKTYNMAQSINLANDLNEFLNEIEKNNCNLDALKDLVDEDYSSHWQKILHFLYGFLNNWKLFLKKNNITSPNNYKVQTIKYYMESFSKLSKLNNPIIIAGNLMTIDTVIDFAKSIKKFDNSYFIFKGFDSDFKKEELDNVNELHENYYFYNFIDKIKIDKKAIKNIEYSDMKTSSENCRKVLEYSSLPYQLINLWKDVEVQPLENIEIIECENIFEEMKTISFYILDSIKTKGVKNIAVICDIDYAHELEIFLKQYNLPINNVFGRSFDTVELSKLLILINDLIIGNFSKDVFLGFLKNKHVKYSDNVNIIRDLEQLMLKDLINITDFNGYIIEAKKRNNTELVNFLENIYDIFRDLLHGEMYPLEQIITKELVILEQIISENEINDENNQKIIDFLLTFKRESCGFNIPIKIEDYNLLLKYFLKQQSYSEEFSTYPAINIIKADESRLINYDLVVIFNCNDGYFPINIPSDPWLNNSMRKKVGLMTKNCEIGKSHYDFIQLLSQKQVLITRSVKVNENITFKSRFLQRLESFLKCKQLSLKTNNTIIDAVRFDNNIQKNVTLIAKRPRPNFNIKNVKEISATNFNTLVKNPYDFYAKYVLKLKDTNVIKNFNTPSIIGSFFHYIFEVLSNNTTKNSVEKMIDDFFYNNEIMKKMYKEKTFSIVKNFITLDEKSREDIQKIVAEGKYSYKLNNYDITLSAKVDRLEFINNISVNVVDYKTGTAPSKKDMVNGKELQLPFTAFIMRKNNMQTNKIDIWSIKRDSTSHTIIERVDLYNVIENMEKFLYRIIDNFSRVDSEFVATTLNKYSDYEHLSRVNEWVYEEN